MERVRIPADDLVTVEPVRIPVEPSTYPHARIPAEKILVSLAWKGRKFHVSEQATADGEFYAWDTDEGNWVLLTLEKHWRKSHG